MLQDCDLLRARDELADSFAKKNAEAEAKGGRYVYKAEFVEAWKHFYADPRSDTAVALLEVEPRLAAVFETCQRVGEHAEVGRKLCEALWNSALSAADQMVGAGRRSLTKEDHGRLFLECMILQVWNIGLLTRDSRHGKKVMDVIYDELSNRLWEIHFSEAVALRDSLKEDTPEYRDAQAKVAEMMGGDPSHIRSECRTEMMNMIIDRCKQLNRVRTDPDEVVDVVLGNAFHEYDAEHAINWGRKERMLNLGRGAECRSCDLTLRAITLQLSINITRTTKDTLARFS